MDLGRSTYRSRMRFFVDDAERWIPVVWYFVDWPTPTFQEETPFRKNVWEKDQVDPEIGEDPQLQTPFNGRAQHAYTGEHFCGTLEQWRDGCRSTDPLPPIDPETGASVCCGPLKLLEGVGLAGGSSNDRLHPSECIDTAWCSACLPVYLYLHRSLATPDCACADTMPFWLLFGFNRVSQRWECQTSWSGCGGKNSLTWWIGGITDAQPTLYVQQPATITTFNVCGSLIALSWDTVRWPECTNPGFPDSWAAFLNDINHGTDRGGAIAGGTSVDMFSAVQQSHDLAGAIAGGTSSDLYHRSHYFSNDQGGAIAGGVSVDHFPRHFSFDLGGAIAGGTSSDAGP